MTVSLTLCEKGIIENNQGGDTKEERCEAIDIKQLEPMVEKAEENTYVVALIIRNYFFTPHPALSLKGRGNIR